MSSTFTCITCRVAFADADLQRGHYKSDWHRYNLKRKVAELPPVSAEGFVQRLLVQKAQAAAAEPKDTSSYCDVCGKSFNSEGAYQSHLQSSKHKQKVKKMENVTEEHDETIPNTKNVTTSVAKSENSPSTPTQEAEAKSQKEDTGMEVEEGEDDEWDEDAIGLEECLFCSKISKSIEANVKHMTTEHNFFIPDIDFLVDMEGFLIYLGEKVGVGKMCLWCNEKTKAFYSVKAVQQHMTDKGHCMLYSDKDAAYEFADYYDYTKSYPEGEEPDVDPDEEIMGPDELATEGEEYQLSLPSGAKIGHRALHRYYKQNLVSRFNPEGRSVVNKVLSHYKMLGWTGATGAIAERRVKDLAFVQRQKQKHRMQLGGKANKTAQHHFRNQIMF